MVSQKLIPLSLVIVLALLAGTSQNVAQVSAQDSAPAPNTPLGTSFTYQGVLKDTDGNPINGSCAFRFILYDAEAGGSQVGPIQELTTVSVTSGRFTVLLDFGSAAFTGEARWLEVAVKCSGETDYTSISPRQSLTPAPYASYAPAAGNADLLDGQEATAFASATHTHWGQTWTGSGTGLTLSGGETGLSGSGSNAGVYGTSTSGRGVYGYASATSGYTYGVYGQSDSTRGRGVYGRASASTGETYGVQGESWSTEGAAVYGRANATSGTTYGVYGETATTSGRGVYGYASATSGTTYGVYGKSASTYGRGLYGLANAGNGTTYGVQGESWSTEGTGVYGWASAESGSTNGVYGRSDSTGGQGVYGLANATGGYTAGVLGVSNSINGRGVSGYAGATLGDTYGVFGRSASTNGIGIYGWADAASGTTTGVYGLSDSSNGRGVYGHASATGVYGLSYSTSGRGVYGHASASSGTNYGVYGQSDSTAGQGLYGQATANSGWTFGVFGESDSTDGRGVYGISDASSGVTVGALGRADSPDGFGVGGNGNAAGVGVGAWSFSGNLIEAYAGSFPGGNLRFYINQAGNVYADGTYSSPASSLDGTTRALTASQSTEVWLEDYGRAKLVDGRAAVSIAPDFAGVANLSVDYLVFVTLEGDCQGVYITNKTPTSFEVREVNDGKSNIAFAYRIVAKQPGSETVRLPVVNIPEPGKVSSTPEEVIPSLEPGQSLDQVQP